MTTTKPLNPFTKTGDSQSTEIPLSRDEWPQVGDAVTARRPGLLSGSEDVELQVWGVQMGHGGALAPEARGLTVSCIDPESGEEYEYTVRVEDPFA